VDAAGSFAVTGSDDKTIRVWSVADGKLSRTIRVPVGPGDIGKIYAVAISPDGCLIAAGGWTKAISAKEQDIIYLFDTLTGNLTAAVSVRAVATFSLAFSPDGRYLAAGLPGGAGLSIFDRDQQWGECFQDTDYRGGIYGLTFAADGRLAVACEDGSVCLYAGDFKQSVHPKRLTLDGEPYRIAFSPKGSTLAVGFSDWQVVSILDGHSLAPLLAPDTSESELDIFISELGYLNSGGLLHVAWSKDGNTLFAGHKVPIAWSNAGRGARGALQAGNKRALAGLIGLRDGGLLVAAIDPFLAVLEADGTMRWAYGPLKADFRGQHEGLSVSPDGNVIDFGFDEDGRSPLRFDLRARKLGEVPAADHQTYAPKQDGPPIKDWANRDYRRVDGEPIVLERYETAKSLAIHPDGDRFVLGATWSLRAYNLKGELLWRRAVPGEALAVNVSRDGRLIVVAHDDGTIRWRRMGDGRELLALYVLADKQNWVAWTPEGFYGATPGAFGVLRWHVNRGFEAAAETVPVSAIPRLRRPDALPFVLQELETTRALGVADVRAARDDVRFITGAAKAPGARLHVLTIGVSDYGEKAAELALRFAHKDAQDVASALLNTQDGGLYAEVLPMFLCDGAATKAGIFEALSVMERNMARGAGHEMAVVMFSGHGAVMDDQFYLVPHGVDNSTKASRKASAISASEFQREIQNLVPHGRVLVLLDACRSAGLIDNKVGADLLRSVLAAGNVTVLTSSKADKLSREDEAWQHGAFSKALLDALSDADTDTDRNGVISMTDLTAYMEKQLELLTGGDQQLGVDQRFQGEIFVAGV
jgi:WD40 repeat protein